MSACIYTYPRPSKDKHTSLFWLNVRNGKRSFITLTRNKEKCKYFFKLVCINDWKYIVITENPLCISEINQFWVVMDRTKLSELMWIHHLRLIYIREVLLAKSWMKATTKVRTVLSSANLGDKIQLEIQFFLHRIK